MGPTLDPHAAFLIQRGMRTYFLRYERQCANALALSEFLQHHPRVKRVHYPGLASHPQHSLAAKQMKDFGSVVTVDLDGGYAEGARFAESLQYFSIAASVGSTESLVMPPQLLVGGELHGRAARRLAGGQRVPCACRSASRTQPISSAILPRPWTRLSPDSFDIRR